MKEWRRSALRILATLAWTFRKRDSLFILCPAVFAAACFSVHLLLLPATPRIAPPLKRWATSLPVWVVGGAIVGFLLAIALNLTHSAWTRSGHRA